MICRAQAKNMHERITKYLCFILKCVENHLNAKSQQNVYVPLDCSKFKVNLHLGDFYKPRLHTGTHFSTVQRLWLLCQFLFLFIQDLKQISKTIFFPIHDSTLVRTQNMLTLIFYFLKIYLLAIFNKPHLVYTF